MRQQQKEQSRFTLDGTILFDYGVPLAFFFWYGILLFCENRRAWIVLAVMVVYYWGKEIWTSYHRGRDYDRIALIHLIVVCPVCVILAILLLWLDRFFLALVVSLGYAPEIFRFAVYHARLDRKVLSQSEWLSRVQEDKVSFIAASARAVFEHLEQANKGFVPDALVLCGDGLKGRIGVQLAARLQKEGYGVTLCHALDGWEAPEEIPKLIVDAMDEPVESVVQFVNTIDRATEVCAIDVPCGIDPDQDDGTAPACAVRATETLALGQWRPIHKNRNLPVADYLGKVRQLRV